MHLNRLLLRQNIMHKTFELKCQRCAKRGDKRSTNLSKDKLILEFKNGQKVAQLHSSPFLRNNTNIKYRCAGTTIFLFKILGLMQILIQSSSESMSVLGIRKSVKHHAQKRSHSDQELCELFRKLCRINHRRSIAATDEICKLPKDF